MHPKETCRIEPFLERSERLAHEVRTRPHVELCVVVGALDPVEVGCRNDDDLPHLAHDEATNAERA